MSDLMLNKTLSSPASGYAVRSVARTVSLTALRRLNGERKHEVVLFLQEAGLIRATGESSVDLADAEMRGYGGGRSTSLAGAVASER